MTFILSKKTLMLWHTRIVFAIVFICAPILLIARISKLILFFCLIVFVVSIIYSFVYAPVYCKNYKIIVEKSSITIKKGIFFKTTIIMPYCQLVFCQTFATPLATVMNMKSIILKATKRRIFIPEIENADVQIILNAFRNDKYD